MSYQQKLREYQHKKQQVEKLAQIVNGKANSVKRREAQYQAKQRNMNGLRGMAGPVQDMASKIKEAVGLELTPGNIGDINSVIWPFYFPTDVPTTPIGQNETFQTGFSVNQEAAFIFMSFVKTIYNVTDPGGPAETWSYLDPDQSNPSAPGLQFTLRDGSSSRQLFNTPMNVDHFGNPRFPTIFPRPVMLLPNQVMQIAFINNSPINTYMPFITAFGYRCRIDDAQKILSLVYG